MTGKTDVRVRPHLTYSVTAYIETDVTGTSREVASGMTPDAANEIAKAVHNASDDPRHLTYFEVEQTEHNLYGDTGDRPEWLGIADARLAGKGEGSAILIEKLPNHRIRVTTAVAKGYRGRPQPSLAIASEVWAFQNPLEGRLTQVEAVVASLKDNVIKEVGRLNLPERWEDLTRETTKRGLETFMAIQTAGKDVWRDHEVEALVDAIQKKTGKSKIALRSMFETATEKARAALTEVEQVVKDAAGSTFEQDLGDLTEQERLYCRHRSTGMKPIAAAKAAGYTEDSAHTLESTATIRRVITAMMAEKPQADVGSGAGTNGSWRLENATQEFFALNVGFYGMTVEDAATQMSLPLATAEGLMQMPSVSARIAFFQRCRAAGES